MLVDIICLVTILLGTVLGYIQGLFKMIARLASVILAFIIAGTMAGQATTIVYDSVVAPGLESIVASKIEETGAEETLTQLYDMVSSIQTQIASSEILSGVKDTATSVLDDITSNVSGITDSPNQLQDAYSDFNSFLSGLSPTITNFIADKIDLEALSHITTDTLASPDSSTGITTTEKLASQLVELLRTPIIGFITPVAFVVLFIILVIVIGILLNFLVALLDKIKITEKLSKIGGTAVGGICAFALAIAIAAIFSIVCTHASDLYDLVDGSVAISITNGLLDLFKGI